MNRAERRRAEQEDDVLKWLGDEGRFIVSRRLTEEAFEFIDSEEHRGRIPSPTMKSLYATCFTTRLASAARTLRRVARSLAGLQACSIVQQIKLCWTGWQKCVVD